MAKKRKNFEPINEVLKDLDVEEKPPECYGGKAPFCKPELCGRWFETCRTPEVIQPEVSSTF